MIKSVFAATAALSVSAGAAVADPYVNVETNAGWTGDDYSGVCFILRPSTTDFHLGLGLAITKVLLVSLVRTMFRAGAKILRHS